MAGEGERMGFGASERDRGFGELLAGNSDDLGVRPPSSRSICWARLDLLEGESALPTGDCITCADMSQTAMIRER